MDLSTFSEVETIRLAQSGNQDAFGELYQRHLDAIYQYIHKRVSEVYEAENLTQTVFMKAWMALERYQPSTVPFRGWLYRIAHNAVVDHYRTQKDAVLWDDLTLIPDDEDTPEEVMLVQERGEMVRTALTQLKPSYQEVLSYRFLNSMDYPETAEALGRKVNAVRVLQHRALDALQKVIGQQPMTWVAIMATVMTLAIGRGTVVAASSALPGDTLYPVKTTVEDAWLLFADHEDDVSLYAQYTDRRIQEIEALYATARADEIQAAVARLTAQIGGATEALAIIAETDGDRAQQLAEQLNAAFTQQTATLTDFVNNAPVALQPTLQSALDAVEQAHAPRAEQPSPAPTNHAPQTPAAQPETRIESANNTSAAIQPTPQPTLDRAEQTRATHEAQTPPTNHAPEPLPAVSNSGTSRDNGVSDVSTASVAPTAAPPVVNRPPAPHAGEGREAHAAPNRTASSQAPNNRDERVNAGGPQLVEYDNLHRPVQQPANNQTGQRHKHPQRANERVSAPATRDGDQAERTPRAAQSRDDARVQPDDRRRDGHVQGDGTRQRTTAATQPANQKGQGQADKPRPRPPQDKHSPTLVLPVRVDSITERASAGRPRSDARPEADNRADDRQGHEQTPAQRTVQLPVEETTQQATSGDDQQPDSSRQHEGRAQNNRTTDEDRPAAEQTSTTDAAHGDRREPRDRQPSSVSAASSGQDEARPDKLARRDEAQTARTSDHAADHSEDHSGRQEPSASGQEDRVVDEQRERHSELETRDEERPPSDGGPERPRKDNERAGEGRESRR